MTQEYKAYLQMKATSLRWFSDALLILGIGCIFLALIGIETMTMTGEDALISIVLAIGMLVGSMLCLDRAIRCVQLLSKED